MQKNPYLEYTNIAGKCKKCGINLWKQHGNQPAPKAMPCPLQGCEYKSTAKVLTFERSATGSPIALIEG